MQFVTWPFKKFLSYVCAKMLVGYLDADSLIRNLTYSDGALCVRDISLNPPKLNENLSNCPYKVLSANIKLLKISIPRHFITDSIKITISDIDILLMPILESDKKRMSEVDLAKSLIPVDSPAKSLPKNLGVEEDAPIQIPQDEDALTKLINKVLSNLEAEVNNLCVRILTTEFNTESSTAYLPTLLLRFDSIQCKNSKKDNKFMLNKTIFIGQIGLFLMNKPILSKDEYGNNESFSKFVFPFTYPPISHPSTILVFNTSILSAVDLTLDSDKRVFDISATLTNLDILISPLQIYTLSHFINYAIFLFNKYKFAVPTATNPKAEITSAIGIKGRLNFSRMSIRVLYDDVGNLKRYYHSYKGEELELPKQIQAIHLKLSYSFFEILIVGIKAELNSTEGTIRINYVSASNNILQYFALKKTGQVLDESVGTIYESANHLFSVAAEESNILVDDTPMNPARLHFCVQKVIELRASTSLNMVNETTTEECEYIIEKHLDSVRGNFDKSQDAVLIEFKQSSNKKSPNLILVNIVTSGIHLDLSADIPVYLDQILNPTGNMLIYQTTQYRQVLLLYHIEETIEQQVIQKDTLEERDWVIQCIEVSVPYIRTKIWMIDANKNTILDFYKERNVDTCLRVLQKIKHDHKTVMVKGNSLVSFQVCRCMDVCRVANELSGITMKNSYMAILSLYYRNELIILDIVNIRVRAREIYDTSKITGQARIQALFIDLNINELNLYSNLGGKFTSLARVGFVKSPYSVRILNRCCITYENRVMTDTKLIDEELKFDCNPEEYFIVKDNEPEKTTQLAKDVAECNSFDGENSDFSGRQIEMKRSAKTLIITNIKSIGFLINLEDVSILKSLVETTVNTIEKTMLLLKNKVTTRASIEAYFKSTIKLYESKKEEVKKHIVEEKLSNSSDSDNVEDEPSKLEVKSPNALLLGVNLSIKRISAYLCERSKETIPLLIVKADNTRAILYKNKEHDLNVKLQVNNMVVVDNSFIPPPFYSYDHKPEESNHNFYKHIDIIKSKEDCQYFLRNHGKNVLLYKEGELKNEPIITISGTIFGKSECENINSSDMESECTINIGINGIIVRPELHTKGFNKLMNIQTEPSDIELVELSKTKSMSLYGNKISNKKLPPVPRQVLKVNVCLRSLTIDIWPTAQLSNLMEIDPPALPPKFVTDTKQLYRVRQRILFLLGNLTIKYISAPFLGKEKLWAHLVNTNLAITTCSDLKQILLTDNEVLLNPAISMLRRVEYSNLMGLESLEASYTSHNESLNNKPLPSIKASISTLMIEVDHNSLVAAIKGTSFILSELENLTTTVSKTEEVKKVETYELSQQKVKEELKFNEDLGKSTIFEDLEVVKQNIDQEKSSMRKVERIDVRAMENAFRIMNDNPEYIKKEESSDKVTDVIELQNDKVTEVKADEAALMTKSLRINTEYIEHPKEVIHQYDTKFHALPAGYNQPKTIFCLSIAKIGVAFIETTKVQSSVEISLQNIGLVINRFPEYIHNQPLDTMQKCSELLSLLKS